MPGTLELKGNATYPGLPPVIEGGGSVSQGVTPGTLTLTVAGLDPSQVPPVGTVEFTDSIKTFPFADCLLLRAAPQAGSGGKSVHLSFLDFRWRWQWNTISGVYNKLAERFDTAPQIPVPFVPGGNPPAPENIPTEELPLDPRYVKKLPELAKLCLKAMGVQSYNIDALPPDATPCVNWDNQVAALALQQLAETHGCRVVPDFERSGVLICKQGFGAELPDLPQREESAAESVKVNDRPDVLSVAGARTRHQLRFSLRPLALEFDGTLRPAEDVSYKPKGGWGKSAPPTFANLPGGFGPDDPRNLDLPGKRNYYDAQAMARRSVYRMYGLRLYDATYHEHGQGAGPLLIPPDGKGDQFKVKDVRQVRLFPFLNQTTRDDLGRPAQAPARVFGKHTMKFHGLIAPNVNPFAELDVGAEVNVPFTVNPTHPFICFHDYVLLRNPDGSVEFPELILECSCEVEDNDTHQFRRQKRSRPFNGPKLGGGEAVLNFEDLRYFVTAEYDGDHNLDRVTANDAEFAKRADFYLAGEAQNYAGETTSDREFIGVLPVPLDGAVQQWSVNVGPGGARSRASRNTEHTPWLPAYAARRRAEEWDADKAGEENRFRAARARDEQAAEAIALVAGSL